MTIHIIARWLFRSTLVLFMASSLLARDQQSNSTPLTDDDKAKIIESVLELESKALVSEFKSVRNLLSDNIEFVAPARIYGQGFTLLTASQIRTMKMDRVVEYVVFRRIYSRDGIVFVNLSRVSEGRPCFAPSFSAEQKFTYEYHKKSGEWIAQPVSVPFQFSFGRPVAAKPYLYRGNQMRR